MASNAVSSKTVTTDVFVLRSVCKPPDIALLPSDQLHPVSSTFLPAYNDRDYQTLSGRLNFCSWLILLH